MAKKRIKKNFERKYALNCMKKVDFAKQPWTTEDKVHLTNDKVYPIRDVKSENGEVLLTCYSEEYDAEFLVEHTMAFKRVPKVKPKRERIMRERKPRRETVYTTR